MVIVAMGVVVSSKGVVGCEKGDLMQTKSDVTTLEGLAVDHTVQLYGKWYVCPLGAEAFVVVMPGFLIFSEIIIGIHLVVMLKPSFCNHWNSNLGDEGKPIIISQPPVVCLERVFGWKNGDVE
jgi:hypothetical protein